MVDRSQPTPTHDPFGEVSESGKQDLLANAYDLLFPIDWSEPFGMVLSESMACGTPSITYRCGSVPELVEQAVTGFIVDDFAAAVAVGKVAGLDRAACRRRFEERFSVARMAEGYLKIYEQILYPCSRRPSAPATNGRSAVHSLLSINDNVRVALAALHAYTAKRMIDYQIQGCRADAEILDTNLLEK